MGETQNILNFRPAAGLTSKQLNEGVTVYEATHAGVTYRVIGTITDPMRSGRRTFRAYRLVGDRPRVREVPAAEGDVHKTRKAAFAQAEADLADVLRDRKAEPRVSAATDPAADDDSNELLDRIVRRAQYTALCEVLAQLDRRIKRHGQRVCVADIRRTVNDAARELRVPEPYRPADE